MNVRLPDRLPGQSVDDYLEVLVQTLGRILNRQPLGAYQVDGPENRTLNAATATPAQTAEVLATLIEDMRRGSLLT